MTKKVSLVLSGGGARGIAHIGVIEELINQDYEISSIAGTSMGALVGGVFALGKMQEFKEWLLTLDRTKVFSLIDFSFSSQGLVKGDRVLNTMKEFIEDGKIENLRIPFAAVAADLIKKEEVVFTSGSIYDAIRASIAIPTVITPFKLDGKLMVDGGVVNNIPVNRVKRSNDDLLIAVNVNANIPVYKPKVSKTKTKEKETLYAHKINQFQEQLHKLYPNHKQEKMGFFDLINNTISMMTDAIQQHTLEQHEPDLLINISHESCGIFDFYLAQDMIEIGQYAAKTTLPQLSKKYAS